MLAVSPCDALLLPHDLSSVSSREGGGQAAMAETAEGLQPLCSIWPVSALPAVADGAHPATWHLVESISARRLHFAPTENLANVNTRANFQTLAAPID
jgi:molybdopterin-guanine dinucleotide biosynthesis protein A